MTDTRSLSATRNVIESLIIAFSATGLSYLLGYMFHWQMSFNILEIIAVWTSYSCTWLCVVERRINYPIGAISSIAYAWLFFNSGLIDSAILNLYLIPTLIYGWIRWNRDENTRPVTKTKLKHIPIYAIISGLMYLGAVYINKAAGGTMAWSDGIILAGSILAQFLMDNKKIENWYIWLIVDIIAVWEYFHTGLTLVGVQYVLFLINTFIGLMIWRKSQNAQNICIDDSNATNYRTLAINSIC